MSLAAFEALPEARPGLEYWDGLVVQKAVGKRRHGRLQRRLAALFDAYQAEHGGDSVTEGRVFFAGHGHLLPDLAYWAPGKPQGNDEVLLPPTLAIEIRSPDDSMAERRRKCRDMRRFGVDACWLLDPETRQAERFEGEAAAAPFAGGMLQSASCPASCTASTTCSRSLTTDR